MEITKLEEIKFTLHLIIAIISKVKYTQSM